ncbi:MAG: hypothetical protein M0Z77_04440 [Thermoplasmatales archaeon]|nr:hypothetical protein [Thermoplasmatales archaeon]
MKIHRYTFIKKRIITTDLDDFTGEAPSSPRGRWICYSTKTPSALYAYHPTYPRTALL